ncbi:protein-glutamine gamma-glutamyltransferase 2, partial [Egretta garzetta]|uniref:protein-glutamine gamma-glutamyltransferase 2 n=1 Tax=Egretta garzetta TaxID=188379 RepID=UPI00163BB7EB
LTLETSTGYQGSSCHIGDFVLLFNAWHPEDTVFLRDEDERCEYVLSQQGLIYQGASDYITSTPWNFGQVSGARPPGTPGQPWQRRARGLMPRLFPRSCTPTAASTPGRISPARQLGDKRAELSFLGGDCANFRAWQSEGSVSAWPPGAPRPQAPNRGVHAAPGAAWALTGAGSRPPRGAGAKCGPAPVRAIKEGDLQLKYDIPFVFAEVNADVVYWVVQRDGSQKKSTHSSVVGKNISTKSVGRDSREDITHTYKYPEGSEKEREVFVKAEHEKKSLREADEGLHLKIKLSEGANNGCDFDVFAVVNNNTDEERICRLMLRVPVRGHGHRASPDPTLPPLPEKSVPLRILYEKYGESLTQDNIIKVVALLTEYQTGDVVVAIRDVYIQNPEIKIRVRAQRPGGFGGDISHQQGLATTTLGGWSHQPEPGGWGNPTMVVLGQQVLHPWGPASLPRDLHPSQVTGRRRGRPADPLPSSSEEPVAPHAEAKFRLDFVPRQAGLRKLMVDFESNKLTGVKGYRNVIIAPQPK